MIRNKARGLYVTFLHHLAMPSKLKENPFFRRIRRIFIFIILNIGAQLGHSDWLDLPLDQRLCIIMVLNTHRQPASGVFERSQGSFTIREPACYKFHFFFFQ